MEDNEKNSCDMRPIFDNGSESPRARVHSQRTVVGTKRRLEAGHSKDVPRLSRFVGDHSNSGPAAFVFQNY